MIIGKIVKVFKSTNKDLMDLHGRVVDETKNIILLQTPKGQKRIPKNQVCLSEGETLLRADKKSKLQ